MTQTERTARITALDEAIAAILGLRVSGTSQEAHAVNDTLDRVESVIEALREAVPAAEGRVASYEKLWDHLRDLLEVEHNLIADDRTIHAPSDVLKLMDRLEIETAPALSRCPRCDSPERSIHYGIGHDGGVTTCDNDWHSAPCAAATPAVPAERGEAWQSIETHDKSSKPILVALIRDGRIWRVSDASFNGLGYYTVHGGESCHWRTHWMPLLPPSPEGGPR